MLLIILWSMSLSHDMHQISTDILKKKNIHTQNTKQNPFPPGPFTLVPIYNLLRLALDFYRWWFAMCCSMAWVQRERVAKCVWLLLAYMLVLEQLTMCIYIYIYICVYKYVYDWFVSSPGMHTVNLGILQWANASTFHLLNSYKVFSDLTINY